MAPARFRRHSHPLLPFPAPANANHIVVHHTRAPSGLVEPAPPFCAPSSTPPSAPPRTAAAAAPENHIRSQLHQQRWSARHAAACARGRPGPVPGWKAGVAFVASLRTNLRLNAAPLLSSPAGAYALGLGLDADDDVERQGLDLAGARDDDDEFETAAIETTTIDGVPKLATTQATDARAKRAVLSLVAASVSEMRRPAAHAVATHPATAAVAALLLLTAVRSLMLPPAARAVLGSVCACAGVVLALGALALTQRYSWAARAVDADWLGPAEVEVMRFGDETIGAVVMDWIPEESRHRRKKTWRAEIVAWTVAAPYRGKGVGRALLTHAVRETRRKGAETIYFSENHANSLRFLPRCYNREMDCREIQARELLQDLRETTPARTRRRRGGSNGSNGWR